MPTDIRIARQHLVLPLSVLVAAMALMVWWSTPARSQGTADTPVDTYAFVARADNPVDALAASSVAGQLGAPVYLTFPASLDEQAAQGLQAVAPDVVVLAGGTAALSEQVEKDIVGLLPDTRIVRKAGLGRTETAKLVNELTGELGVDRPVLAGATVAGDVGIDGTLTVAGTDVIAALQALSARVDGLEADLTAANGSIAGLETDLTAANDRIASLEATQAAADDRIAELEATLTGVTRDGNLLTFSAMNVQIVNGQGTTATTNGLGNLIVGYNEDHTDAGDNAADERTGSHNVIIGVDHTYTSYGGLVLGRNNTISGRFATVSGGVDNTASSANASVSGGEFNTASSPRASVSGGFANTASSANASVSGGEFNTASGNYSSVSGGFANTASESYASVTGGYSNTASGHWASVSGGHGNTASGPWASVSGGASNAASGQLTSVAGGLDGTVPDDYDSRIGNTDFPDSF